MILYNYIYIFKNLNKFFKKTWILIQSQILYSSAIPPILIRKCITILIDEIN